MKLYGPALALSAMSDSEFDQAVRKPFFAEVATINVDGHAARRMMVALVSPGCTLRRKASAAGKIQCPFCVYCNYFSTNGRAISVEQYEAQIDWALSQPEARNVERVDVLLAGSFLEDSEVSPEARAAILSKLASQSDATSILFEAKASDLTNAGLTKLDQCLDAVQTANPNCKLELAIGLETANLRIGRQIGKCAGDKLNVIMRQLQERGVRAQFYALVKPVPMSESEAVEAAVETTRMVADTAKELDLAGSRLKPRISLSLTHTFIGSALAGMPEYKAPRLWSVVEVIEQVTCEGMLDYVTLQIGLSTEELPTTQDGVPKNCGECDERVIRALEHFNATQHLESIACSCRGENA